jgi:hypothetical protein
MYYAEGSGFWVLKGDGRTPPPDDDWHKLRFDTYDNRGSSYLTNAGQLSTLHVQPYTEQWASLLLPDIYHSRTAATPELPGGLTGELPIFLGLMAFTTTREYLQGVLPRTFSADRWLATHNWQAPRAYRLFALRNTLTTDGSRDPQARPRGDRVRVEHGGFDANRPVSLRMRNLRREVLLAGDSSGAVSRVSHPNIIMGYIPLKYVSCSRHLSSRAPASSRLHSAAARALYQRAVSVFVFARLAALGLVFPYVYVVCS